MTQDCVIYYKENMDEIIPDEDIETTLGRMNLFVVPVTAHLLTTQNTAMTYDLDYASKEGINILPIMMESGLDDLYSCTEVLRERQYINPFSEDTTEISYEEKLKKYLQSVLISDDMAQRVRAAFDAYVFLSYRKKDRRYANELMKLIHKNPECRDIAVWYDEFLVPGESFKENIEKILDKSALFTLLVTPNVLEEPNGLPNYVVAEEYPRAKAKGMDILPVEMDFTNKEALKAKFEGLPDCVDAREEKAFYDRLLESLLRAARTLNDGDPEHNFLIGLAYFEGIDVEVDRIRGKELITSAAESGLVEAMEKIYGILASGGQKDAEKWAERLVDYYEKQNGAENEQTLKWKEKLARRYGFAVYSGERSKLEKSLELSKEIYELRRKSLGEYHEDTIRAQCNLASDYGWLNDKEELRVWEEVYAKRCKLYGDTDLSAVGVADILSGAYRKYGELQKSRELQEKLCSCYTATYGEDHPEALKAAQTLAYLYEALGEYEKAMELGEKVYRAYLELFGEDDQKTLISANNLGVVYDDMGDKQKAVDLLGRAYRLSCKKFGIGHNLTQTLFYSLGYASIERYKPSNFVGNDKELDDVELDLSDFEA